MRCGAFVVAHEVMDLMDKDADTVSKDFKEAVKKLVKK